MADLSDVFLSGADTLFADGVPLQSGVTLQYTGSNMVWPVWRFNLPARLAHGAVASALAQGETDAVGSRLPFVVRF